mmetsp:Transcript_59189/g.150196  ORF Transcript_59189/g.150196 Transcript_59189/m.150196 type:complete len:227 (-) Transcript_59189:65-745(-)
MRRRNMSRSTCRQRIFTLAAGRATSAPAPRCRSRCRRCGGVLRNWASRCWCRIAPARGSATPRRRSSGRRRCAWRGRRTRSSGWRRLRRRRGRTGRACPWIRQGSWTSRSRQWPGRGPPPCCCRCPAPSSCLGATRLRRSHACSLVASRPASLGLPSCSAMRHLLENCRSCCQRRRMEPSCLATGATSSTPRASSRPTARPRPRGTLRSHLATASPSPSLAMGPRP